MPTPIGQFCRDEVLFETHSGDGRAAVVQDSPIDGLSIGQLSRDEPSSPSFRNRAELPAPSPSENAGFPS